jgi:hypothetical protein
MSFDYECLNMDGLAAPPIDHADREKSAAMKDELLQMLWDGEIKKINLGKMKWRLEPIGDHEQLRKNAQDSTIVDKKDE